MVFRIIFHWKADNKSYNQLLMKKNIFLIREYNLQLFWWNVFTQASVLFPTNKEIMYAVR